MDLEPWILDLEHSDIELPIKPQVDTAALPEHWIDSGVIIGSGNGVATAIIRRLPAAETPGGGTITGCRTASLSAQGPLSAQGSFPPKLIF